ncbi:hypothetical protein UFOVP1382_73 [uncultured Caudovirales phage]|uniref:Uncharacterized protein n=1 Tax=uncultured Caudovirales phage TaxID=2100421 RepID=A0A6J5S3T4_9CAUD|nr:hypothetical protein UFOVP1382_73 [uncultured Caudovirales phage]
MNAAPLKPDGPQVRLATPDGKALEMSFNEAVFTVKLWDSLEDRLRYMDPDGHGYEIMQAEIAERDATLFEAAHEVMVEAMDGRKARLTEREWEESIQACVRAKLAGTVARGWATRLRVSAYRSLGEIHISVGTLSAMFGTSRIS